MSGNPGFIGHSVWCLERCLSGACVRGWLGTLLLIWALGLGAPGDALPVDLETDLAATQARTILKLDLRGRGCSEPLVSASHGGVRTDGYGDGTASCVHGVRCDGGSIQSGVTFRRSLGSWTGEGSESSAGVAPKTVLAGGIHGVSVGRLDGVAPGSCCRQSSCIRRVTGIATVQDGVSKASHESQCHECDKCCGNTDVGQDAAAFSGCRL